ncbi:MAG TPA: replication/maintenance protein RepL [Flavobacterium sp.]|nr:replication/maintenance protein RepL [Flavobacterium sp.]
MKVKKITDFEKNIENPFLKEAVQQIQSGIVKKYKNTSGTSRGAILQAVNSEGELVGHTSFIRQIEVDEQQFTKIYLSQFSAFFELNSQSIKVFGYIMTKLMPKQDFFIFDLEECLEYTGYKSGQSVYNGLSGLIGSSIIARGKKDYLYFINPMVFFNGDRVTFAKTYVKKQKGKIIDPMQTNLLEAIDSAE